MPAYQPPFTLTTPILSLAADISERIGRLWQTLLLSNWQPLFAYLPVESLVHRHQSAYYQAIESSTVQTDCAPFIQFMLTMIRDALADSPPPPNSALKSAYYYGRSTAR